MEASEAPSEASTGQPQASVRSKGGGGRVDTEMGDLKERIDDSGGSAKPCPTRAEVAVQLDQLGDAMLAEVEAALEADAKGEGCWRSVDEPGQKKLTRLASLDVLSEILSWDGFEWPEKGEKDSASSRPPFKSEGEMKVSGAAVEALLKGYDSVVEKKSQQQKGGGESESENMKEGEDTTTDPTSALTQMEVDQEIVNAMVSKNPLWDEHSLGRSRSTRSSEGSARSSEGEDSLQAKSEALGGSKRKAPELSGGGALHGPGGKDANRFYEGGPISPPTPQQDDIPPLATFKEQSFWSRTVEPPTTESQSSSMTHAAHHQRAVPKPIRLHASSLPSSPASSPRFSPKMHSHSHSFKEGGWQHPKDRLPYSHCPLLDTAAAPPLRAPPRLPQPPGGDSQRMRFTPQQQKQLHAFGSKVNWVGPGIEGMDEAHAICGDMGMDIKQLKKWISNHRPKEFRTSTSTKAGGQPAWLGLAANIPGVYSEAALQSLSAAQPALMGNGFLGPFEPPPFYAAHPPWGPPPYGPRGMGLWPYAPPAAMYPMPQMGRVVEPDLPHAQADAAETSAVEAMLDQSSKSGDLGESEKLELSRLANADNLRQVLGRKLKDFDPTKVQKLVELCKKYRQEQSASGTDEPPPGVANDPPPSKKQATSPHESSADGGANPPLLDLDKGREPEGGLRARWGGSNGLHESPPPTSDALAAYLSLDASGWEGMTDLSLEKDAPLSQQSALPVMSSKLVHQFSRNAGNDIFGSMQTEEANLQSVNPFYNGSMAAAMPPHAWPNPAFGLSPGYFFNSPANPSLENVPLFPPHDVKERKSPKSPKGQLSRTPRTVLATHMRGGSSQPNPKSQHQTERKDGPASRPVPHQQTQLSGTYLFEKVLTASDTSPLGRIILPKSQAELHLPKVLDKEGGLITVEDADGKTWELRYRFWPNNKSRIYVFEHTAEFIQSRGLRPGDVIVVCRAPDGHLILNDRRRPCSPDEDRRAASEGSRSTVSSGSSCTHVRGGSAPGSEEHADGRTASGRDSPQIPTQRTWRQLSMEDITRWALTGDGQDMMDFVNLDHAEVPAEDPPHVLEIARDFQGLRSSANSEAGG